MLSKAEVKVMAKMGVLAAPNAYWLVAPKADVLVAPKARAEATPKAG